MVSNTHQPLKGRGGHRRARSGGQRGDRDRGGKKASQQDSLITGPVKPLQRSASGWKRPDRSSEDEETVVLRTAQGLLNKLTLEKYDQIVTKVLGMDINTSSLMNGIIEMVFEKVAPRSW